MHKRVSLGKAYDLSRTVDFAWVLSTDWYRSGFAQTAKSGSVKTDAGPTGRKMARGLMTRGHLIFPISEESMLDEHDCKPTRNTFHRRAARCRNLFRSPAPFDYDDAMGEPGYRMRHDATWLIVEEICYDGLACRLAQLYSLFQMDPDDDEALEDWIDSWMAQSDLAGAEARDR
jgi:hypothetical protein